MRWINVQPAIQSELNQKNKYCILMHIYGILKNVIFERICRERMETYIERVDLWTQWGKERVG